jgi:hypothetical protein
MAAKIKITLYHEKIQNLLNSPRGDVGRELSRRAKKVQVAAKRQVRVRTGRLRNSIRVYGHSRTANGQHMYIGSSVPYALMHHEGTRKHTITPKRKSYLKFRQGAVFIYRKKVNHPGTKANRYLTDNLYLFYS